MLCKSNRFTLEKSMNPQELRHTILLTLIPFLLRKLPVKSKTAQGWADSLTWMCWTLPEKRWSALPWGFLPAPA